MEGPASGTGDGAVGGPAPGVPPPPGYRGELAPLGANQRRQVRRQMVRRAVATEVLPGGKIGPTWPCQTMDLSRGGLRLISRRLLPPGATILLRVEGLSGRLGDPLFCGVMHVSYLANGEHRIGVEFRPMPRDRGVAAWVARNRPAAEAVKG